MNNTLIKNALILLVALWAPFSVLAQETALPQNYMMEKHGISEPFYCDLEDPTEEIACMAWDAALGATEYYFDENTFGRDEFNLLVSISVMNLIQQKISGLRSMVYFKNGFGGYTQEVCLIQKRGSCGNHQFVFERAMNFAGIENRRVGVYMELNGRRLSHAMNEIILNNKWILFDTTNAATYIDQQSESGLLSLQDLTILPQGQRFDFRRLNANDVHAFSLMQNLRGINEQVQQRAREEQFAYLLDETKILGTLYNAHGSVFVDLMRDQVFEQLPNYVGTNTGTNTGITMRWTVPDQGQTLNLRLDVAGVGGCSSNGPILLDDAGNEYPLEKGSNQITVPNGGSFNVKRDEDEICYIVFNDIAVLN
jgi:hypothetical protein